MAQTRERLIGTFLRRSKTSKLRKPSGVSGMTGGASTQPTASFARQRKPIEKRDVRAPLKITEDDPRWNASTMGDKTGMYRGRWYSKGKKVPFDMRGQ